MIENHQLYIRVSKRTFCLNDNKDFEDETNFKTNDIKFFKQVYTSRPEIERINLFLALFRIKKSEIERISQVQILSF